MKSSNKSKRGGSRPGSGRPALVKGEASVTYCGKVPESMVTEVDSLRGPEETRSDVLRDSLESWIKRRKRRK